MADTKKLTGKDQRDSIVQAYNNPQAAPSPADMLAKLHSALGGAAPAAPEPAISPADAQYQAETGDDHIAALQQANLAQAQTNPEMAAKLAATQEAIKRYQMMQAAKLQGIPSVQQQMSGKIGQQYPSEE